MKISARNQLIGTVTKVTFGPISAEVVIQLPGGQEIAAVITRSAAESLKLTAGQPAYAIVKASNVLVGVD